MSKKYAFKFIGYEPYYGELEPIEADNTSHAENKAMAQIADLYPELQDVEITEREVI